MKHATIKDIAKELNLSFSTVSRALTDKPDIRKETKEMILSKAREMNYHPNLIARKLLTNHSYAIGVVIPELSSRFFPEVILGIQNVFIKEGYQVLIMPSNESCKNELENIKLLENNMVDGIIISCTNSNENFEYYKKLIEREIPLVMFNRVNEELKVSKVVFDDYKWAFFATEHLIYQGYKKIFHFSGPLYLDLSKNRINGFNDALKKHRIEQNETIVFETGLEMNDGDKMMNKLIEGKNIPEAIFTVNEPTAIGVMNSIKKHGYRIPEDIALIGFSESNISELLVPSLTSVAQPTFNMGQMAAQLLLDQINSKGLYLPQTIVLNGRLNVRESSMKLK